MLLKLLNRQSGFTLTQKQGKSKGFTLIEVLMVITIIGVLVIVGLIAINPGEQIRRAKDANAKTKLITVASAAESFFTLSAQSTAPTYATSQTKLTESQDLRNIVSEVTYCSADVPGGVCKETTGGTCSSATPCTAVSIYIRMVSQQAGYTAKTVSGFAYATPNCTATSNWTYFVATAGPTKPMQTGLVCLPAGAKPPSGMVLP